MSEDTYKAFELCRERLHELLSENNINLEIHKDNLTTINNNIVNKNRDSSVPYFFKKEPQ